MASLFDLVQQYLKRDNLPKQFTYDRTPPIGINPPTQPGFPGEPIAKILPVPGGNEDGFSVYNPDPNRTRNESNYSPYAMRQAYAQPDSDVGIPSGILSDSEFLYGKKSGLESLMSKLPGQQILKGITDMLPFNRRAAFENELLGGGIMLDDIGRVVSNDYNTAEGIMSGYNANMLDPTAENNAFDKRQNTIANTLSEKYGVDISSLSNEEIEGFDIDNPAFNLVNRYGLIDKSKNIFNRKNIIADVIEQNETRKSEEAAEIQRQKDIQDAINKEKSKPGAATFNPNTTSGGAGDFREDRDNSGDGGYGNTGGDSYGDKSGSRSRDNRSSDLGFSDIRLKENVELIGKSPSNINIYKFNYKDNPTTYQGTMAHEVPWASVKHSNGYMMVDYSKLDVQFKKL